MNPAAPDSSAGAHLVLYDGVCGLCNRLVRFVLANDRREVFKYASLQSATGTSMVGRWGGDPRALTSFYVIADFRTPHARVFTRSDATLFVAGQLGWPWRIIGVGALVPKPVRDAMYDLVGRMRYRVFGRYDTCPLMPPEFRNRFIE